MVAERLSALEAEEGPALGQSAHLDVGQRGREPRAATRVFGQIHHVLNVGTDVVALTRVLADTKQYTPR